MGRLQDQVIAGTDVFFKRLRLVAPQDIGRRATRAMIEHLMRKRLPAQFFMAIGITRRH